MASVSQIIGVIVACAILIAGIAYWFETKEPPQDLTLGEGELTAPLTAEELAVTDPGITNTMNPVAQINTNQGVIELELFADQMPITVGNFVKLAEEGFYNDTKFHRVIEGFMIQGGDPNTKTANEMTYGQGGPGYTIQDEFVEGELLTNTRGTIAMANTGQPNSGGSQFFINLVDNTPLDFDKQPLSSRHPVFGRVVGGLEVVDAIGAVETNQRDLPIEAVVIESVEIVAGDVSDTTPTTDVAADDSVSGTTEDE
jgi:peptidylprolyl isomerase